MRTGPTNPQLKVLIDELRKNGKDGHFVQAFSDAASLAEKLCGAGDVILTLGAGETNKVADLLVHKVESL